MYLRRSNDFIYNTSLLPYYENFVFSPGVETYQGETMRYCRAFQYLLLVWRFVVDNTTNTYYNFFGFFCDLHTMRVKQCTYFWRNDRDDTDKRTQKWRFPFASVREILALVYLVVITDDRQVYHHEHVCDCKIYILRSKSITTNHSVVFLLIKFLRKKILWHSSFYTVLIFSRLFVSNDHVRFFGCYTLRVCVGRSLKKFSPAWDINSVARTALFRYTWRIIKNNFSIFTYTLFTSSLEVF